MPPGITDTCRVLRTVPSTEPLSWLGLKPFFFKAWSHRSRPPAPPGVLLKSGSSHPSVDRGVWTDRPTFFPTTTCCDRCRAPPLAAETSPQRQPRGVLALISSPSSEHHGAHVCPLTTPCVVRARAMPRSACVSTRGARRAADSAVARDAPSPTFRMIAGGRRRPRECLSASIPLVRKLTYSPRSSC